MFTLRVLGTIELDGPDGRRVSSILSQPKRLALLVLLVLEGPGPVQRDTILGRLWPELPEERARRALRQALYYLRRSLGPGVVESTSGEGVEVAAGSLECDAVELERAHGAGRYGEALQLYAGELLPGFHLDGGPAEFESWLESERRRMGRLAAESARLLAEQEEAAGNAVAAGAAARRAWDLGEWGEPALQELLELLIRTGDRTGARAAYEEYARRLDREFGTEPSPETRALIEALEAGEPGAGAAEAGAGSVGGVSKEARGALLYAAADVGRAGGVGARGEAEDDAGGTAGATAGATAPAEPSPDRGREAPGPGEGFRERSRWGWRVVVAGAGAVLVATVLLFAGEDGPPQPEGAPTLYLEPVRELAAGTELDGVAEAVGTELAARLGDPEGFRVVLREVVGRAPGEAEGVQIRPSLGRVGAAVRLSVLLLDNPSGAVLDRLAVEAPADDPRLTETLAGQMAPRIREGVGDVLSFRGLERRGLSPRALALVRAASREVTEVGRQRADGAHSAAQVTLEAADSLLREAERLDPRWLEPILRRAELRVEEMWLHLFPPNVDGPRAHRAILEGLEHADRGVELAPSDGRARQVKGQLLLWAAMTTGDPELALALQEEAEEELLEAVRLDAGLSQAWNRLAAVSERRGEFPEAYYRARRAFNADYDLRVPLDNLVRLFTAALEVGDVAGAREWCMELHNRYPGSWVPTYCDMSRRAWAGPFEPEVTDSIRAEGYRRADPSRADVRIRFDLLHAVVLARSGNPAEARDVLAVASEYPMPDPGVLELRAWVRAALGEDNQAQLLLATLMDASPSSGASVLRSRRFEHLTGLRMVRSDEEP